MRSLYISVAIAVFGFTGTALAQPADKSASCRQDVEKFCKGVHPGEGRIVRCLVEKKDQLSPGCKEQIEEGERKHPCYADTLRLCKDVKPGEGRIVECMKHNEAQLSPACKARIGQERARKQQDKR